MAITTRETLDLVKAGIDTVMLVQSKSNNVSWQRIGPAINHDEGFYRARILASFGDASVINEGQAVPTDQKKSLYQPDFYPFKFAKAYEFTIEAKEDDVYKQVGNFAADLARSMRRRKNKEMANILNNGFSSSLQPIYDASALFADAHAGAGGNTGDNLSTTASLGSISLETMITDMMNQPDPNGELMEFEGGMALHVPNALFPLATRIVDANGLAGTPDNDPNFVGRYLTVDRQPFLTSTTAFFLKLKNEDEHGLRMIQFTPYQTVMQDEARTLTKLVVVFERYVAAVLMWQGVQGNVGA
jgi:hypothetical protein